MTFKKFIDTNILVYALDQHDPVKNKTSRSLLKNISETKRGVISTQVIQEFNVSATRNLELIVFQ